MYTCMFYDSLSYSKTLSMFLFSLASAIQNLSF